MSETASEIDVTLVSDVTLEHLNERQRVDYREFKAGLVRWLFTLGKHPERAEGYAESTVAQVTYKVDVFYRWVWDREGYTTKVTPAHADDYLHEEIAISEHSNGHKATVVKCLKRLFKYRRLQLGEAVEWEPDINFTEAATNPRDFLTLEERRMIREAALDYGSVPSYQGLSPVERDKWKAHLAQRFDKPKSNVAPDDFKRANGWKFPSLVWVSLDAGLRPIEVKRSNLRWIDIENKMLRIPKEESSKNTDHWAVALSDRTAEALRRWLDERGMYSEYADSDAIWLTREGNPYHSQSLRRLLHRLCNVAGISTENRTMSWYTIRHSVGTYMTREEDLAAAKAQLRHRSPITTMKYDQVPVESRRGALDRMG